MRGNGVVGILREVKNKWERRVPLVPSDVKKLVEKGLQVLVQPSPNRVFSDDEYASAGAVLTDDLSKAGTILGVKEFPHTSLQSDKAYMIFSHTIKAQPENMPFLDECLQKNVSLLDYEKIANDEGHRLVAFGEYAGLAGMVDGLRGLGEHLLSRGFSTPLLQVGSTFMYDGLDDCEGRLKEVGQAIAKKGLPKQLPPLVFAFTGRGRVYNGARQILNHLPVKTLSYDELTQLRAQEKNGTLPEDYNKWVYAIDLTVDDLVAHKNDSDRVDMQHYIAHPDEYEPVFHQKIAPHINVLVNGMYWEPKFPRLLSKEQMHDLHEQGHALDMVVDITCDIEGSVEALSHSTQIEAPFFTYNPATGKESAGVTGKGTCFLAVDNLPTELPKEASESFSNALTPLVPGLAQWQLSPELSKALITHENALTDDFDYITELRKHVKATPVFLPSTRRVVVLGSGMVSAPLIEYLRGEHYDVTIVSDDVDARKLLAKRYGCSQVHLRVGTDDKLLQKLVREHDAVVSLLPATAHVEVAKKCVENKRHLITASYVSDGMQGLHEQAQAQGIALINEVGLDPGLDHMSAQQVIDHVKMQGGRVLSFESLCGGLPAPAFSDNALQYKFSWSPRGVLTAATNAAQFLRQGQVLQVPGSDLLSHATPITIGGMKLEHIPNRNSLPYGKVYGIEDAHTVFRGTLRYEGTCRLMHAFAKCQLLSQESLPEGTTWREFLSKQNVDEVAKEALDSFGVWDSDLEMTETPLDSLCAVLLQQLAYAPGEEDMCVMQHRFEVEDKAGQKSLITSSLVHTGVVGDIEKHSSMALTVGMPTAIATDLLLKECMSRRCRVPGGSACIVTTLTVT
ncbi:MAG: hypothetical protein MHM6MM_002465 [Cercozoa sp. M6MM]